MQSTFNTYQSLLSCDEVRVVIEMLSIITTAISQSAIVFVYCNKQWFVREIQRFLRTNYDLSAKSCALRGRLIIIVQILSHAFYLIVTDRIHGSESESEFLNRKSKHNKLTNVAEFYVPLWNSSQECDINNV